MGFEHMSFGAAVSYVQVIGLLIDLLILSVPISAVIAIARGKRNRPDAISIVPYLVLWGWLALLVLAVAYFFFTGAWYGENGPEPQVIAARITIYFILVLVVVVAVQAGLYRTTRAR